MIEALFRRVVAPRLLSLPPPLLTLYRSRRRGVCFFPLLLSLSLSLSPPPQRSSLLLHYALRDSSGLDVELNSRLARSLAQLASATRMAAAATDKPRKGMDGRGRTDRQTGRGKAGFGKIRPLRRRRQRRQRRQRGRGPLRSPIQSRARVHVCAREREDSARARAGHVLGCAENCERGCAQRCALVGYRATQILLYPPDVDSREVDSLNNFVQNNLSVSTYCG